MKEMEEKSGTMRVAVIGEGGSVYGYKLIGMDVFPADTCEKAQSVLKHVAESNYAIIYLAENFYKESTALVETLSRRETPAIVPIPTVGGATGFSAKRISKFVEQAVGSDILFGEK
ncbi:MAG: V-type ATP synthase subunit F [Oscillospiraceae bacterium]|jgi:V/A-type H+-transporting ATPase subunit F|nr:V-type ATP synthase subunit F [Oscillospiraceae bacterium]